MAELDDETSERLKDFLDSQEFGSEIGKINRFSDTLARSAFAIPTSILQNVADESKRKTDLNIKETRLTELQEQFSDTNVATQRAQLGTEKSQLEALISDEPTRRAARLASARISDPAATTPEEIARIEQRVNEEMDRELSDLQKNLEKSNKKITDYEKSVTDASEETKKLTKEIKELNVAGIENFAKMLVKVSDALKAFVTEIRNIQQQFGIDAGQAFSLGFQDIGKSIGSMFGALTGGEAYVTREQIQQGRSAFQSEFGGLITPEEARRVAQRSAEEGITAQQQAMARRVFITESRGDVGGAERREAQFLQQFENANLTAKDAMDAIAKNSEILYRNGDRFRDGITRAAIEAKKIGVDLSSIERYGDNLINDFEGFLEGQAELGAMGFGFDTSRLAEIAATGDTEGLMNELQSQLSSTGKNLDTLTRPERLALESAFGMSIGDMKKLTSGEGGSGKSMEQLQELGNKSLEKLVNRLSGLVPGLAGISAILGGVHTALLMAIAKNTAAGAAADLTKFTNLATGLGKFGMGAAGLGIGTMGIATGMDIAKESDTGLGKTAGILTSMASGAAGGAMIGTAIPGVGTLIGAGVGAVTGLASGIYAATADDMISKPGYGERILLHENKPPIALNDEDTLIAYADDLVSSESGVKLLSKGDAAPSLDISPLAAKLDAVVQTINQMSQQTAASTERMVSVFAQRRPVYLNGNQVGYEMAENEQSAAITAPFRVARTNRG